MTETPKPPYGTIISKPEPEAGVEVGGGDKAAAAVNPAALEEGRPGGAQPDDKPAEPDDADEAQSPT